MDKNMFKLLVEEVKRINPNRKSKYDEALLCVYIKGVKIYIRHRLGLRDRDILSFYEVSNNKEEFLGSWGHGITRELRLTTANFKTIETDETNFKNLVNIVEKLKAEKTNIEDKEKTIQGKYEKFMEGVVFDK